MKKKWILFPLILFVIACSSVNTPTPAERVYTPTPIKSGVQGQAVQGPICPVVRKGEACPDSPYQAVLTVRSPEGKEIVQVQTDEQGYFSIPLPPGSYVLHPESPEDSPFPYADEQTVVVYPGQFTTIIVLYDTGIR